MIFAKAHGFALSDRIETDDKIVFCGLITELKNENKRIT
jgi:hypothetical protein